MNQRARILFAAALLLVGCGESDLGRRYRAERELYWADKGFARLVSQRERWSTERWRELADRYEAIAREHVAVPLEPGGRERLRTREVAARALFSAAQIHAALNDSLWVDRIFEEMSEEFEQGPDIAGELWLARGRTAENRGEVDEAIAWYRRVLAHVRPDLQAPGIAGSVLELPLRIARLQRSASDAATREDAWKDAHAYYDSLANGSDDVALAARARWLLAETHAVAEDWNAAGAAYRQLRDRMLALDHPPIDPSTPAVEALTARHRAGARIEMLVSEAESLAAEPRMRRGAGEAFLRLSTWLFQDGAPERALTWVDRAIEVSNDVDVSPRALFLRGQILDRLGDWGEALTSFRLVQVQYPITEPALRAYAEIAAHHARMGETADRQRVLDDAERHLRAFIARFPSGAHTHQAYRELIRVLDLMDRPEDAVDELLAFGEHVHGSSREPSLLVEAARRCQTQLDDPGRAAEILDRLAERFPATRIGAWASHEAQRLRAGDS